MIKTARTSAHMTQAETAKLLSIPKRTLEEWEAGRRSPKMGQEYWAARILAIGNLTETGREALAAGEISLDDAMAMAKRSAAKAASKIGSCGDTFAANWDRIPANAIELLPAETLAQLVDAMYDAYSAGKMVH